MKIKRGGGGVDAQGNWYKLSLEEVEVPNDYFQRMVEAFKAAEEPKGFIPVSADIYELFKEFADAR